MPDHLHKSARELNFKSTRNFCSNHYGCCYRNKQYAPNRLSLKMRMSAFFPQVPTAGLTFPPIKQSSAKAKPTLSDERAFLPSHLCWSDRHAGVRWDRTWYLWETLETNNSVAVSAHPDVRSCPGHILVADIYGDVASAVIVLVVEKV